MQHKNAASHRNLSPLASQRVTARSGNTGRPTPPATFLLRRNRESTRTQSLLDTRYSLASGITGIYSVGDYELNVGIELMGGVEVSWSGLVSRIRVCIGAKWYENSLSVHAYVKRLMLNSNPIKTILVILHSCAKFYTKLILTMT